VEKMRYLSNIVTLKLDAGKCNGCTMCIQVCPHAVLAMDNGKIKIVDRDACMECGACAKNCPEEALSVNAGVGCAIAIIAGTIKGTEPNCDCCGD
jgi:NAD-dependent dihydropyrimidine dehydrogenase PreA subunit